MKFSAPNVRDFRVQIFISFSLMILIILIWFLTYLTIDRKIDNLNNYSYQSFRVSQDFSANIKGFQTFLLYGYKEKNFYINQSQKDLKEYLSNLKKQREELNQIFKESKYLYINVDSSIQNNLFIQIDSLIKNVALYKKIALKRGFKDYGVEGKMREKAHLLEENKDLNENYILQFRRHEKDYLLRSEQTYIDKHQQLFNQTIRLAELSPNTKHTLREYKYYFDQLVILSNRLGISPNQGIYGEINRLNEAIENNLHQIIYQNESRIQQLKKYLLYMQIGQTIVMIIIALFLCIYISKYFTKDIKSLSLDMSQFIFSNFKNSSSILTEKSSIKEIDFLFTSYKILKERLVENVITLEKNTEIANNTAKFKTQFLANMSHEIRSPLNGVIGMLNILKTSPLNTDQTEYIEIAEHSANHLLGIVNMILDHSKMEAGKMKLEKYPIHLKKELSKLIRLFEYRVKDKNIALEFSFDRNINSTILCDNLRLQQVLINLLDNAVKFTAEGKVKLDVQLIKTENNIQHLNFRIIDSGIGIETHKIEQLLLAFEQADLTTTRKYGGTGLGLTISNQLIQLMGGSKLKITARKEGGSCFCFDIPLDINTSTTGIEIPKTNITNLESKNIQKSLIVEDNIINQKVLKKLLDKINISADIAKNGFEALSLYEKNDYDIIFMDLHMPEMDGFQATEKIHSLPKYQINPTPIIAVTASAFEEDKIKAISMGMDDFITKPVVLKNLEELIAKQSQLQN
ncbi:response regulator [Flavobacterium sp. MAHUQ-51]|uniref:response regulator n=1 Tax=Flavobacterium sp. GCM10022190 TaxID=3252639 RepID=UPI0036158AC8